MGGIPDVLNVTVKTTNTVAWLPGTWEWVIILICLVPYIIAIVAFWKIFSKAGHSGALSLLLLIPVVNWILILWFGFSEWPVTRELRALKGQAGRGS